MFKNSFWWQHIIGKERTIKFFILIQQVYEQSALKNKELEKPFDVEMSDHEVVTSINIISTLLYSFKVKLSQLSYLDSDYEDIIERKKIIMVNQLEPMIEQELGLAFLMLTLVMNHNLKLLSIITNFSDVPI